VFKNWFLQQWADTVVCRRAHHTQYVIVFWERPKNTVQKLLLFSALAFVSSKQPRSCVAFRQVPIT